MKENLKKHKKNLFYILLAFLPIIDLITSLQTRFTNLSLTLGVAIKGILLLYIIYYLFFKCKSPKKKWINCYLLILLLFSILYIGTKPDISSISNLITEVTNLFKFSFYPILVIGLINMEKEKIIDLKKICNILSYTFIGYIIFVFIPYITNTGFKSYELLDMSNGTVGWFFAANEIGSIIIILLSFVYLLLEKKKYLLFLVFGIIGSYTAFIIGTKVASFGVLIVCFIMILYYFIYKGEDKWKKVLLSIIIFGVAIYSFRIGPTTDNVNNAYSRYENTEQDEDINIETENELQSFLISLLSGREKFAIRVYRAYINANTEDKIFGLGFTYRESLYSENAARLVEMDFFDMFFRFGIVGFILLILPVFYMFIDIIKKVITKKYKFTLDFWKYFLIWAMIIAIAFISGHVMGSPAVSFYLGIITLLIYKSLKEVKQ